MDVTARLIELKPGSEERVREWAEYLRRHREEANATLRAEGVSVESWFEIAIDGKRYLLGYARAKSANEAAAVAAQADNAVDSYHRQFKADTWVRGGGAEARLLLDLDLTAADLEAYQREPESTDPFWGRAETWTDE
jgi:hypothetical protein